MSNRCERCGGCRVYSITRDGPWCECPEGVAAREGFARLCNHPGLAAVAQQVTFEVFGKDALNMANVTICECDAEGCNSTARVQHQFQIPPGWVRRAVVDSIGPERNGEGDISRDRQFLFCEKHLALNPPVHPDIERHLGDRARRAAVGAVVCDVCGGVNGEHFPQCPKMPPGALS